MSMAFVCLVMFLPTVQAEDFEATGCYSGEVTLFHKSKELQPVMHLVGNGIIRSNSENKFLDNVTFHSEGLRRGRGEKQVTAYFSKWTDPDGDIIIAGGYYTGRFLKAKLLEGTGKYKGITGSFTSRPLARGKPAMAGTFQGCTSMKGTFELPPK